jgi:hypothetical protein
MDDPRKVRLMTWLTTPPMERNPKTQVKLAESLGISKRTLTAWMNQPEFRDAWERQARAVQGTPERQQVVLDVLYAAATDPHNRQQVQAAKLFLEATRAIRPPTVELRVRDPRELTDEELDSMLAEGAAQLAEERAMGELLRGDEPERDIQRGEVLTTWQPPDPKSRLG